jgi:hypothetical protein
LREVGVPERDLFARVDPEELVGAPIADLWRPEVSPQPNGIALRSTQARTPRPLTDTCSSFGLKTAPTTLRPDEPPLVDDDGSPAGVVSGVKIVDELVEAQRDLEAQRANLQAVFDSELMPGFGLDPVR